MPCREFLHIIAGLAIWTILTRCHVLPSRVVDVFEIDDLELQPSRTHPYSAELVEPVPELLVRDPQSSAGAATNNNGTSTQGNQLQDSVPATPSQTLDVNSTQGSNGTHQSSGFITNDNSTSPGVNCSDPSTGRANECWGILDLNDWVKKWNNSHTCRPEEGFSTCFLRQTGYYSKDCSGIKLDSCSDPDQVPGLTPEAFYVAYNIYAINQFFNSWYDAVGSAGSIAGLNVDQIIQITAVPDNTNFIMDNIYIALTGLFAFAPVPIGLFGARLALSTGLSSTFQIVENALFVWPQMGRFLFPPAGPGAKLVAIAEVKSDLVNVISDVQGNLNKTLNEVMADVDGFLAYASQGNFSRTPPSLADQVNYLTYGFNTYVISAALAGNDVHAVLALDTNPHDLSTNGTKLQYDIGCKGGYNEEGVCGQWWWDNETNIAYGLDDFRHMNRDMNSVLTQLLQTYTTPELLFKNAYACFLDNNEGGPVNVTVDAAGVNTACLSQLNILRWDSRCSFDVGSQNGCEFLDGPPQNTWLGNCGSHSAYSVMDDPIYCVPKSYLGPLLTQNKYKLRDS